MKKLFITLVITGLFASIAPAFSQKHEYKGIKNFPVDSSTHLISYVGVIEAPGATKAQLYARTKAWLATRYNSAKAVIEVDDPENGQLIGQGRIPFRNVATGSPASYPHTLKFRFKDGRMRYEITQIREEEVPLERVIPANPVSKKIYDTWWERLNTIFIDLTKDLQASIVKPEADF